MKLFLRFILNSFLLIVVVLVGCPTAEEIKLLNQGIKHFDKRQYDKAISDFTKAIELNPKSAEAYYRRGIAYVDKANVDKALSDLNKAIELNPEYPEAYCGRGFAYTLKAVSEWRKGAKIKKIDPKSADSYYRSKDAYFDNALSDLNKALELNPEYSEAYDFRVIIYSFKGQNDKVKADLNKRMEIHYWRAISYQLKSQYEKACFEYRRACRLGSEAACGEIHMFEEKGFFCQQTQSWILKIKFNRVIQ